MSNIIQTFPKGGSPTYAGLPDKPTVNDIDIETLSIEGMDVVEDTTNNVTEISAPGLNADSMADVTSGEVNNYAVTGGNTYTTGEQIVGRWIDGKPIYKKVYSNIAISSSTNELNVADLKIKDIISISGKYIYNNDFVYNLPHTDPNGGLPYTCDLFFRKSVNIITFLIGSAINTGSISNLIIEYTKTTDT